MSLLRRILSIVTPRHNEKKVWIKEFRDNHHVIANFSVFTHFVNPYASTQKSGNKKNYDPPYQLKHLWSLLLPLLHPLLHGDDDVGGGDDGGGDGGHDSEYGSDLDDEDDDGDNDYCDGDDEYETFIAMMIVFALSSAPCFELFSAAPAENNFKLQKRFQTLSFQKAIADGF